MSFPSYLTEKAISDFIRSALAEDIGEGDYSTLGTVLPAQLSRARLMIKDNGILAGVDFAQRLYRQFDPQLKLKILKNDGDPVLKGEIAFVVEGPAHSILSTERVVLNCMQRMSGIATYTHRLVALVAGTHAVLLDTRKTTPNFRLLEKWAVAIGGGRNHRYALYDMVMLKDNHIDLAGGVIQAIDRIQEYLKTTAKQLEIEVETRDLKDVTYVIQRGGVDIIMLDNMDTDTIRKAVEMIAGRFKTEASGGINENNLREIAETGVDYISVGALTHSVKSLDLSLKVF